MPHPRALLSPALLLSSALSLFFLSLFTASRFLDLSLSQQTLGLISIEGSRLSWSTPAGLAAPDGVPLELPAFPALEISRRDHPSSIRWGFGIDSEEAETHSRVLPLWLPAAASAALAGLLFLPARRALNLCTRCAYDLQGLAPAAPCPECAHPTSGRQT